MMKLLFLLFTSLSFIGVPFDHKVFGVSTAFIGFRSDAPFELFQAKTRNLALIFCLAISCTPRERDELVNPAGKDAIATCGYISAASSYQQEYGYIMETMHKEMTQVGLVRDDKINFLKQMIPHHQGAIDMAEAIIKCTDDRRIVNIARGIITEQRNEIAIMENMIKEFEVQEDLNNRNK